MKVSAILIVLGLFAPAIAQGQDNRVPYVFEMKGGKAAVYGLADPEDAGRGISVKVLVEEPWNRTTKTETLYRKDIETAYEEPEVSRKIRIEQNWKDSGNGVEIETASGKQWVFKSDLDLARRALEAGRVREAAAEAPVEVTEIVEATPVEATSGGGIGQWWVHGLIVIGTAFFGCLIFWWGFIRRGWSEL